MRADVRAGRSDRGAAVRAGLIVGLPLKLIRGDHQTCASLVVHALQQGGMLEELDPDLSLPADLAKRFDVMP